jgi:replicative DNA helicase
MIDTKHLEESIVGILMRNDDDLDHYLGKLRQEYFKFDLPRFIFNAIQELRKRLRPVDAHLVIGAIRTHFEESKYPRGDIIGIAHAAPPSKNLVHYIQELIYYRHKDTPGIE